MTLTSPTPGAGRPLLNLLMTGRTHGKRSPVTCLYKCDNACFHPVPNTSDNGYFRDIADSILSRRAVLAGGAAAASALVLTSAVADGTPATAATATVGRGGGAAFGFTPIAPVSAEVDALTVPEGFRWTPIIRWGDPLFDAADAFDPTAQTAEKQARQFGYNNDYLDILVAPNGREAVLVANQEYTNAGIMFPPAASEEERLEQLRVSKAAHGLAVVELERRRRGDVWRYVVGARRNRRITADTTFVFDGPAAGSDLLKTVADPAGTHPVGTFGNWELSVLAAVAVVFLVFALLRPLAWRGAALHLAYERSPALRPTLVAVLVTIGIGMLVNDSGVAIPAMAVTLVVPLALAASVRALELDASEPPTRARPPRETPASKA